MKKTKLLFQLFVLPLALSFSLSAFGQIENIEEPVSSTFNLPAIGHALDYTPSVDWLKIAEEDDVNHKDGNPLRVGITVPVNLNINNSGDWLQLPDGRMMWRITLKSEGATSLGLAFDQYNLPEGSKLFIYNDGKQDIVGALGSHNNTPSQVLSVRVLHGNTLTIEYVEPTPNSNADAKGESAADYISKATLNIGELFYVYTDAFQAESDGKPSPGSSQYCQVDVNCSPVGDDWKDAKRGVAHIVFKEGPYLYVCSGSLINNTNEDGTPYFLTAYHCGGSSTAQDKKLWQFYFNFERPNCGSGSAPQNQVITGCEMLAGGNISGGSDFLLLLLDSEVPSSFDPYFNGWSNISSAPESGVCIHHPAGDVKKISTTHNVSVYPNEINIGGSMMPANSVWRVHWSQNENGWGVTEGGSSGSPLFNNHKLIIGTLSGGSSACNQPNNADFFGRLSYHWQSNGSNPEQSLKTWLDPLGSGVSTLKGYDPFYDPQGTVFFQESFEKSTFPPKDWTIETTVSSNTWKNSTGYNITGGISIIAGHGSRFAYVEKSNSSNQNEWLISPEIDLTEGHDLKLSFLFNGNYTTSVTEDKCDLTVKGRMNGGSWVDLWTEHDFNWDQTDNWVWLKARISDLEAYEGKDKVQFAFVYTGMAGANFNIDNVLLYSSDTGQNGNPELLKPRRLKAKIVNDYNIELKWQYPSTGEATAVSYAKRNEMTNIVWPAPERATRFSLLDFGQVYPAEISKITHVFYQHSENPWPEDSFKFKIYAADGTTELHESESLIALHNKNTELELDPPLLVTEDFYVAIIPAHESGHPSSGAKMSPIGTGHSYYLDEGSWVIYQDSEDNTDYEYVTSVEVTSNAKMSYGNKAEYSPKVPKTNGNIDKSKIAAIDRHDVTYGTREKDTPELSGYRIYRNQTPIAIINNPGTTIYVDENLVPGSYSYYIVALYANPEGASLPSNTVSVTITSITNDLFKDVTLYPNPFSNNISITNAENVNRVMVTNLMGQKLLDMQLNGTSLQQISTDNLARGVYLITLMGHDGSYKVAKMVKQ